MRHRDGTLRGVTSDTTDLDDGDMDDFLCTPAPSPNLPSSPVPSFPSLPSLTSHLFPQPVTSTFPAAASPSPRTSSPSHPIPAIPLNLIPSTSSTRDTNRISTESSQIIAVTASHHTALHWIVHTSSPRSSCDSDPRSSRLPREGFGLVATLEVLGLRFFLGAWGLARPHNRTFGNSGSASPAGGTALHFSSSCGGHFWIGHLLRGERSTPPTYPSTSIPPSPRAVHLFPDPRVHLCF